MMNFLLIDFGTTRIKVAIVDIDTGKFSRIADFGHLPNCSTQPMYQEISVSEMKSQFLSICSSYYALCDELISGIVVCSQMGGYVLVDKDNQPLTDYISWKDERSLTPIEGISSFEFLKQKMSSTFRQITGMKLRPSFPVASLMHMARNGELSQDCKAISIPELICTFSDGCANVVHPTMIANFGVYDIYQQKISETVVNLLNESASGKVRFNNIADETTPAGYWYSPNGKAVPIYAGVGDHQCTILGAGNISNQAMSINIGTGSQVAVIDFACDMAVVEQRPYFSGGMLSTITHIPAGRVLEEHVSFLEDVAKAGGLTKQYFWDRLANVTPEQIVEADLLFDLASFKSAWGYTNGGQIRNITEGALNLDNYLAGLLKSFCLQYKQAIQYIDPDEKIGECILSGLPRRLPNIKVVLGKILKRKMTLQDEREEEPLLGLRMLAIIAAGRANNYQQAAAIAREYRYLNVDKLDEKNNSMASVR